MNELLGEAVSTDAIIMALAALTLILAILVLRLELKLKKFLSGKDGKSLEGLVMSVKNDIAELDRAKEELDNYLLGVEKRLKRSIQGVGTVRFNPFKGTGGGQSFAAAFLSEHGNGVVISTLYSRERVSVFAKPIQSFASEYELTGEEKQAIEKAKKRD